MQWGIYGGGRFSKICLSIQSQGNEESNYKTKSTTYREGIAAEILKDSADKKLFLLALIPRHLENYKNVLQLWSALYVRTFKGAIATHLKLGNILVDIMTHSSD